MEPAPSDFEHIGEIRCAGLRFLPKALKGLAEAQVTTRNCLFTHQDPIATMSALRLATRFALRSRTSAAFRAPSSPLLRRGYADVAPDKIQLTLALPHQVRLLDQFGDQLNAKANWNM